MEIFKNIKNSIYSPKFYKELLDKPFSFSFKYFAIFALTISLFVTIIFSVIYIPGIKFFIDEFGYNIVDYYPEELQVTIKSGQVSINVQEPYFIKLPDGFKDKENIKVNEKDFPELDNILVIDTKNDFNLERFNSYKTFALLTKDSIISYSDNKGINIQPIDKNSSFYVDKKVVNSFYEKVRPFIIFIYPIIILFIFIFYLFIFIYQMAYLLFAALIVWLACIIKKVKIDYKKAYQLGFHLITPIVLIQLLMLILGVNFGFPFMFTILLFLMALINIKNDIANV